MWTNPLIALRRHFFSQPVMNRLRGKIPPLSETERIALEAGTVWWDGELFSGSPDWNQLLQQPANRLSVKEKMFIDGDVQRLCLHLNDWTITHKDHDLPPAIWQEICDMGLFGLIIPTRYGGLGFSAYAHSQVVMKLASRSVAAAVTVMVPNSLGPAKLLLHYGTTEQKERYLPRLAKGLEIPCFALTNPHAGSDASAIPDLGIVEYGMFHGQRLLGIRLNWKKRYITLGPVATLIGLAFQLHDPHLYLNKGDDLGITLALIPRQTQGIKIGARHITMGIPFQNGPNEGHNVFIPMDWVIGADKGIGQGWRMLMESLSEGRSISLPALATGAAKSASRYTGAYAQIRTQFNRPIGDFEGVREALARIAGLTYQMDAARCLTLSALDQGEKPSVISAIIKYHLTESYRQAINDAMDIQAGSGICLGESNLIGRIYQAIPIAITVEGANILTRSLIIFGQGSVRCHPFLLDELNALSQKNPSDGLVAFDRALSGHMGLMLKNTLRSIWFGLTQGRGSHLPKQTTVPRYFQQLNQLSASFALLADFCILSLGAKLKRKESLSARLGDIFSQLYLLSACLKHFHDGGEKPEEEVLLQWNMAHGCQRIQSTMREVLDNHPTPWLAKIMQRLVMPLGQQYRQPPDRLVHQVGALLLHPSVMRDRLTQGVFVTDNPQDAVGQLELALNQSEKVANLQRTLREAEKSGVIKADEGQTKMQQALSTGVLTAGECDQLLLMQQLQQAVIRVDEFDDYGHADWHKQDAYPLKRIA